MVHSHEVITLFDYKITICIVERNDLIFNSIFLALYAYTCLPISF